MNLARIVSPIVLNLGPINLILSCSEIDSWKCQIKKRKFFQEYPISDEPDEAGGRKDWKHGADSVARDERAAQQVAEPPPHHPGHHAAQADGGGQQGGGRQNLHRAQP